MPCGPIFPPGDRRWAARSQTCKTTALESRHTSELSLEQDGPSNVDTVFQAVEIAM